MLEITHRLGDAPRPSPPPSRQSHYATTFAHEGVEYKIEAVYEPPPHYAWNKDPRVSLTRDGVGAQYGYIVASAFRPMLGLFAEDVRVVCLGFLNEVDVQETLRLAKAAKASPSAAEPVE